MPAFQLNEDETTALRAVVEKLDHEISNLSQHATVEAYGTAAKELLSSWSGLHKLLAPVNPPVLRECPGCKRSGMWDAKRCGYCWLELAPLATPAPSQ